MGFFTKFLYSLITLAVFAVCVTILAGRVRAKEADNPIATAASFVEVAHDVQSKVVKLFGAGGVRGLEAYQSGILITAEGHVLTAWSYVLDADDVTVVLDDGRRFTAQLVAADPLTEIAVLKCEAVKEPLPHFDLGTAAAADVGTRVLAFGNVFGIATGDEPVSVLHGTVSVVAPLEARRGAFATHFRGDVYIVDAATNNPGASGGALTDQRGHLIGMLGKELRSELTGTWLNYALPVEALAPTIEAILAGRFTPPDLSEADRPNKPLTPTLLGIVLVPDVVTRTPPYIDRIVPASPAARAGLEPDDLLVMIDSQVATSCRNVVETLARYEQDEPVRLSVLRDDALLEFTLEINSDDASPGADEE